MQAEALLSIVLQALEDIKAIDIQILDVRTLTPLTDYMVIASGRSTRHVKAIADAAADAGIKQSVKTIHIEGAESTGWVLVDLGDIIVHVMQPEIREYYQLEKLWSVD